GKGASRRLRRLGKVPAVLYGGHRDPRALSIDHAKLLHQLENEAFYSQVLKITVGNKTQPCILKDVQRHPHKQLIMHIDFQRVMEDEQIRKSVPLHFEGEDKAPGKKAGGVFQHTINEIEVTCLPGDLPEYIAVDVSGLDVDQNLHLSDITFPSGVQSIELHNHDNDLTVVSVQKPRAAKADDGEEKGEGEESDS
ncbi:MAG: 50S ribosomal protein L25/general stress protein Ctc, partial [Pseudomonadota bacterium]